jgi:hypothetical protein
MALTLHVHHFHPQEYLRTHSEQALLAVYVVALAIVVIAMMVAGFSLVDQARTFPMP